MNSVKIFTDSTSDLCHDILSKNDIGLIPLYVGFGNNTLKDGLEIKTEELYKKVEEYGILPKTSAPSPNDFFNSFKPFIDKGYNIVYISISSKLSSTIQNAKIAASEFDEGRIEIVDSLNLSTGIGLLVMKAVDYAKQGYSSSEIANLVKEILPKVETNFIIDTLDYLYKGGRCSALQSTISNVLKIRPIIKVVDGKMIVGQKIRGKRKKALKAILNNTYDDKKIIDKSRLMITHSMADEDAIYLKNALSKHIDVEDIIITKAGCVISSHCGPNTIGILYIKN